MFISSVTYLLKDERNALPPFLRLFDHEPLRFEDFVSQDRSGREACLAGVEAADVYLLLLGPKYGDPFADSMLSPTAEEFRRARARGIQILVFNKTVDEPDDPAQKAFKDEVGHYVNGRFWKSFTDPLSLNQAVGEALKEVTPPGGPLRLRPLSAPPAVAWLSETGLRPAQVSAPVLEVHLLPVEGTGLIGATGLTAAAGGLARDSRSSGFVTDREPLDVGSDNQRAWAVRAPASSGGWRERTVEQFRGLIAEASGASAGFLSLPTDLAGALVDQPTLQRDIARLVALAAPHVAAANQVVPAVGLSDAERVGRVIRHKLDRATAEACAPGVGSPFESARSSRSIAISWSAGSVIWPLSWQPESSTTSDNYLRTSQSGQPHAASSRPPPWLLADSINDDQMSFARPSFRWIGQVPWRGGHPRP